MRSAAPSVPGLLPTEPIFQNDALKLGQKLARMTSRQNAIVHGVSEKLALETTQLHANWLRDYPQGTGIPAAMAYTGDAYTGLMPEQWSAAAWKKAHNHLRIGSGLYGCLKPTDRILPYRCEMGLSWPLGNHPGPTSFWKKKVTAHMAQTLSGDTLLDLSSGEYGAVLDSKGLKAPVVRCDLRELKNGKAVFVSVFGKRARGSMARHVLEHDGPLLEVVDSFTTDGYALNSALSTPTLRVFTRDVTR